MNMRPRMNQMLALTPNPKLKSSQARKLDKALATSLIGVPVAALSASVGSKDGKEAGGGGKGGVNTREVMEREFQKRWGLGFSNAPIP